MDKKLAKFGFGAITFVLFANLAYFIKTEMGIKLTSQPHHGWLFPVADRALYALHFFPPK